MAPNPMGKSKSFPSGEPLQIISTPHQEEHLKTDRTKSTPQKYKHHIVWRNILIFIYLHVAAVCGLYYTVTLAQAKSVIWGVVISALSGIGVTCGAHRLWAHRSYKAKLTLRILLAMCQTIALQNHLYEWVRDHRVHHKFTDTDADPHNSSRGFFFSHMGWLLVKKHKDVLIKGKTVDMSDLEADPVVRFQRKYYLILTPIFCLVLPTFVPWYFWNENWAVCWYSVVIFRYVVVLHCTWLVNSAAHIWGTKPFDKNLNAAENKTVAFFACGEGWHNYHHVFPWDYKAAELGNYRLNFSTSFIDLMAKIGWAYDLKTAPVEMITKRAKRTGDGTRKCDDVSSDDENEHIHENPVWGWDDKDMTQADRQMVKIHNAYKHR